MAQNKASIYCPGKAMGMFRVMRIVAIFQTLSIRRRIGAVVTLCARCARSLEALARSKWLTLGCPLRSQESLLRSPPHRFLIGKDRRAATVPLHST